MAMAKADASETKTTAHNKLEHVLTAFQTQIKIILVMFRLSYFAKQDSEPFWRPLCLLWKEEKPSKSSSHDDIVWKCFQTLPLERLSIITP